MRHVSSRSVIAGPFAVAAALAFLATACGRADVDAPASEVAAAGTHRCTAKGVTYTYQVFDANDRAGQNIDLYSKATGKLVATVKTNFTTSSASRGIYLAALSGGRSLTFDVMRGQKGILVHEGIDGGAPFECRK